jgi:hypothetical protein
VSNRRRAVSPVIDARTRPPPPGDWRVRCLTTNLPRPAEDSAVAAHSRSRYKLFCVDHIESALATIFFLVVLPAVLVSGWWKWWKQPKQSNVIAVAALLGMVFATVSMILAAINVAWAHVAGAFTVHDPYLVKVLKAGAITALLALCFGIVGVWRKSALRWQPLVLGFGVLLFWALMIAAE